MGLLVPAIMNHSISKSYKRVLALRFFLVRGGVLCTLILCFQHILIQGSRSLKRG